MTPQNLESLTKFNLPKPTERYTQNYITIIVMGVLYLCEFSKNHFFHLHEKNYISFALFLKLPGNDILP